MDVRIVFFRVETTQTGTKQPNSCLLKTHEIISSVTLTKNKRKIIPNNQRKNKGNPKDKSYAKHGKSKETQSKQEQTQKQKQSKTKQTRAKATAKAKAKAKQTQKQKQSKSRGKGKIKSKSKSKAKA